MIQIGGVYTNFCQREGILLQKYRERNGRCIAILFKSIGVMGRFDRPENLGTRPRRVFLGARLRGRTATQRSKKGSEKVLEKVLRKGSQKGSEKGTCYGFYSKKGF